METLNQSLELALFGLIPAFIIVVILMSVL